MRCNDKDTWVFEEAEEFRRLASDTVQDRIPLLLPHYFQTFAPPQRG